MLKENNAEKNIKDKGAVACHTSGEKVFTCPSSVRENVSDKNKTCDRKRKSSETVNTENVNMEKGEEQQRNADKKSRQEVESDEVEMASDEETRETSPKASSDVSSPARDVK